MILISNGTVVTMDDARSVHFGGHVVIDGDRITAVGPGSYTGDTTGAEVIDAAGMIVLPGLIDLHYHTAVGKGLCDHLPLWESLEEFWYPSIRALDAGMPRLHLRGYSSAPTLRKSDKQPPFWSD